MDILLGDALRPYEGRQTPDISLEHAFVHREVWTGPDKGVSVIVVDDIGRLQAAGFGIALCVLVVLLLCRRRLDQLMVTENFTRPALVARLGGGERPGRSLLVRLQQAPILARPVVFAQGADLLSGHFPKPV